MFLTLTLWAAFIGAVLVCGPFRCDTYVCLGCSN